MSYTDLNTIKLFLNINVATYDDLLTSYIDQTKSLLDSIMWDFTLSERTFFFQICDIMWWSLRLPTRNITNIISIDWNIYDWDIDVDYQIEPPYASVVTLNDFWSYLTSTFHNHKIVVTCWYETIPKDLILLQNLLISWLYNSEQWLEVDNYKLWDRAVSFRKWWEYVNEGLRAENIINLYRIMPSL